MRKCLSHANSDRAYRSKVHVHFGGKAKELLQEYGQEHKKCPVASHNLSRASGATLIGRFHGGAA